MNDFFLADDLSGALEVAAAFHNAGRSAVVTWSSDAWRACAPEDVVGFTTETRNAPPEIAKAEVTRAVAQGRQRGGRLLFKKIDSTMRGPVAAELAAVAAALPDTMILFTPANPHAGRTVREGILLVKGVPVAESEFGRDPANPVIHSSIRSVVPPAMKERVIALDVTTDDDFRRAIAARETAGGEWVAVASGALARVLVPMMEEKARRAGTSAGGLTEFTGGTPVPRPDAEGILFVCGSAHPMNRIQAARVTQGRKMLICEVNPTDPGPAAQAAIDAIRGTGAAGLHVTPRAGAANVESQRALVAMVQAALAVAAATGVRRIMATGGETARALCDAWGIRALRVLGDVEPGLVLAAAEGAGEPWLMAIKPGGFGDEETWVRAADALREKL